MAEVFLAVARGPVGFNKLAVVKRLRRCDDADHVRMFLDEACLSARLQHPNIVHTYDVGQENGELFLAMEYLEGQSLHALLSALGRCGEGLSCEVAVHVALQVLKGLHYAHELRDYDGSRLGIVHRDVSPQNIFVTYGGEVKLLDFGIAKATVNSNSTEAGILKGKPRYMAPEQAAGQALDQRSDVFAMGIVLWEMIARRRLYEGDPLVVLASIVKEDAPTLSSVRPSVPPALSGIVAKALSRDRGARHTTADELRVELESFLRVEGHRDGDAELATLMGRVFDATRKETQARVRAQLEAVPASAAPFEGTSHAPSSPPPVAEGTENMPRTAIVPLPAVMPPPPPPESSTAGIVVSGSVATRRSTIAATLFASVASVGIIVAFARGASTMPPPHPSTAAGGPPEPPSPSAAPPAPPSIEATTESPPPPRTSGIRLSPSASAVAARRVTQAPAASAPPRASAPYPVRPRIQVLDEEGERR